MATTVLTGCSSTRYSRSSGQYIDDKTLAMHVSDALDDNSEYKFDGVDVKAFRGTVQLSGFVDTEQQKNKAGQIAEDVQGVKDVKNNVTVKSDLNNGK